MSGGYLDYKYHQLEDMAYNVDDLEIRKLMLDLSNLLHDYDYYMSGDVCEATYLETLEEFKKEWFGDTRNKRLKKIIDERLDEVKQELIKML